MSENKKRVNKIIIKYQFSSSKMLSIYLYKYVCMYLSVCFKQIHNFSPILMKFVTQIIFRLIIRLRIKVNSKTYTNKNILNIHPKL